MASSEKNVTTRYPQKSKAKTEKNMVIQKLGNTWYAFVEKGGECYYTKVEPSELDFERMKPETTN